MTKIIGISAFFHDSAAALIIDDEIIYAAQEERFTRKKHDSSFPHNSIINILKKNNLTMENIDYFIFYDKPFLKFDRLLETYISFIPRGIDSFRLAMPIWLREKLFLKDLLIKEIKKFDKNFSKERLLFSEHHLSHAASAFFPSPFEEAIILTIDGVGEWATTSVSIGRKNKIDIIKEIHFPNSLGLLYSAFTQYIGFKVNSGEYKLMGLAPYGKPTYVNEISKNLIDIKKDGSFQLDQKFFNYSTGLTMINRKFEKLFGEKTRKNENDPLTQFHMDIAASIQSVTEEIVLKIVKSLVAEYNINNLCLAGGVALNCVANGKIIKNNIVDNIWIQPAAGDAGGALGAALVARYHHLDLKRTISNEDKMKGSYLGPSFDNNEIYTALKKVGAVIEKIENDDLFIEVAACLKNELTVGWFQGRMEFGPRALGGRSIIADPRSQKMQKMLNLKIKYRESFRPFAPSVLAEETSEWFDLKTDSPYMLIVADVLKKHCIDMTEDEKKLFGIDQLNIKRSSVPAITHVDYSARVQTVHKKTNAAYHSLISEFKNQTGCPVLVNTSFNIRGEPIVCTPEDAYKCFMGTEMDLLVLGNYVLRKLDQPKENIKMYRDNFDLD